jgi:hypothetical protein
LAIDKGTIDGRGDTHPGMTDREESVWAIEVDTGESGLSTTRLEAPRKASRDPDQSASNTDVGWRNNIIEYLTEPDRVKNKKVRRQALKYAMVGTKLHR